MKYIRNGFWPLKELAEKKSKMEKRSERNKRRRNRETEIQTLTESKGVKAFRA